MSQTNKLDLSEFLPIPPENWKKKILEELKKDSPKDLEWQTKGLTIEPFYTQKDLNASVLNLHNDYSYKSPRHWYVRDHIYSKDIPAANAKSRKLLQAGAESLTFFNCQDLNEKNLWLLLQEIAIDYFPIHFVCESSILPLAKAIAQNKMYDLKGSIQFTLLTEWINQGTFNESNLKEVYSAIQLLKDIPRVKVLSIDSSLFHEMELGFVNELAYSLSLAIDYIDQLTKQGANINEVLPHLEFSFSIGPNYFLEIAKLRAFRFLWKKIIEGYQVDFNSFTTPLHGITSKHYFSNEDHNKNIIQNTTEAMSAILGGCDSITILPFDGKEENEFSTRISRNISHLLKKEAYFEQVVDPAGGSYYIERMTQDMIVKAWTKINFIEQQGGFIKAWEKGLLKN
jgi:methylmalonyl-CoA mutase